LFFVLLTLAVVQEVKAHEWYDRDCCDAKDCTPVTKMEFKSNGDTILYTKMFEPITIQEKWWGQAAQPHAYNGRPRIRPSMDSGFHVCAVQFKYLTDAEPKVFHHVRCLYAPAGG
jgi:hypothetical protein